MCDSYIEIPHCHICYSMDVELDYRCRRCEQLFCYGCSATMTYHNQLDYACCHYCSDQEHRHGKGVKISELMEQNSIKLDYKIRELKLNEILSQ